MPSLTVGKFLIDFFKNEGRINPYWVLVRRMPDKSLSPM
jgi:polyribonucleotide nucleotidyltransferase